jgi:transcriptional regulator with XRE-family HTH domain
LTEDAWRRLAADFADELAELRATEGLSWDDLAARSGVSRTYLRDLSVCRGRGLPSERIVAKVAAALGVPADHFRLTRARALIGSPKVIDTVYAKICKRTAA